MRKLRVYFNGDCLMYGVQEFQYNVSYFGEPGRWVQISPPIGKGGRRGQSAYTYYRGVAERWLKQLQGE